MNQYAAMARQHWTRWLPGRVEAMDDPNSFFSTLGDEVATEIEALTVALAGDDPPGEDYLTKVGRLNMARLQAEERVLAERVLLTPQPGTDSDQDEPDEPEPATPAEGRWVPLVEDPADPWWQQAAQEETSR